MDFRLSDEQNLIRETVREFAENEIKPLAIELDKEEKFSCELTKKMGELGLFGMFVSEKYGGQAMDYISYIIAVEELARIDASQAATIAAGNSLGIGPLYYFGNEKQKKKYLPRLCAGEAVWGLALTEPNAGSDLSGLQTKAVLDKDKKNWIINGSKIFITNASTPMTDGVTVLCRTGTRADGKPEYSMIIVEFGTKGFTAKEMHDKMMWRASNTSELYFDNCVVPKGNILGKQGDGFKQAMQTLDGGRLSIAAMGLGGAQGCFDIALPYIKERKQFGKRICDFQVNQFKLANMAMEIEMARNFLYRACWFRNNNMPFSKEGAMSKLYCSELMGRCADQCVQLMGGSGLMKEYHIERFFRDQKILDIGEGTSEIQRLVISRHVIK